VTAAVKPREAAPLSAGISLSILAVAAFSVNMYTLPLDVFGAAPAGFAIAALVSSYGLISAVIAPIVGTVIDRHGYTPVIEVVSCCVLSTTKLPRSSGEITSAGIRVPGPHWSCGPGVPPCPGGDT